MEKLGKSMQGTRLQTNIMIKKIFIIRIIQQYGSVVKGAKPAWMQF